MENLKREFIERQAAKAAAQGFLPEIKAVWEANGSVDPYKDLGDNSPERMAARHQAMAYYQIRAWFQEQKWELYAPESMNDQLSRSARSSRVVTSEFCSSTGWTWTEYVVHGTFVVDGVTFQPEVIGQSGGRCWYGLRFRVLAVADASEPQTSVNTRLAIMRRAVRATAGGWLEQWSVSRSGSVYVHSDRYGQLNGMGTGWRSENYRVSNHASDRNLPPGSWDIRV